MLLAIVVDDAAHILDWALSSDLGAGNANRVLDAATIQQQLIDRLVLQVLLLLLMLLELLQLQLDLLLLLSTEMATFGWRRDVNVNRSGA